MKMGILEANQFTDPHEILCPANQWQRIIHIIHDLFIYRCTKRSCIWLCVCVRAWVCYSFFSICVSAQQLGISYIVYFLFCENSFGFLHGSRAQLRSRVHRISSDRFVLCVRSNSRCRFCHRTFFCNFLFFWVQYSARHTPCTTGKRAAFESCPIVRQTNKLHSRSPPQCSFCAMSAPIKIGIIFRSSCPNGSHAEFGDRQTIHGRQTRQPKREQEPNAARDEQKKRYV